MKSYRQLQLLTPCSARNLFKSPAFFPIPLLTLDCLYRLPAPMDKKLLKMEKKLAAASGLQVSPAALESSEIVALVSPFAFYYSGCFWSGEEDSRRQAAAARCQGDYQEEHGADCFHERISRRQCPKPLQDASQWTSSVLSGDRFVSHSSNPAAASTIAGKHALDEVTLCNWSHVWNSRRLLHSCFHPPAF